MTDDSDSSKRYSGAAMTGTRLVASLAAGPVSYSDTGTGTPLLFFHGVLANGRLWERVVPLLEDRHRCIVPDWPLGSHTHPQNPDADLSPPGLVRLVLDFMDDVGVEKVVLVGNDTGGALCQMIAADHPGRVSALVLTPCDAYEVFPPPALFALLRAAAGVPGGLKLLCESMRLRLAWRAPVSLAGLSKSSFEREFVDAWFGPAREDASIRRDTKKVIRGLSKEYTLAAAAKLKSSTLPTLVAWPREAKFFRYSLAERLAGAIPNAHLVTIPDAYAFVALDQPVATANAIAEFVSSSALD